VWSKLGSVACVHSTDRQRGEWLYRRGGGTACNDYAVSYYMEEETLYNKKIVEHHMKPGNLAVKRICIEKDYEIKN
jgi:hypothetical protein